MNMHAIKRKIDKQRGVAILPLKEYEELKKRSVPTYHLSGEEARELDMFVEGGLEEYKAGKTKKICSLADAD